MGVLRIGPFFSVVSKRSKTTKCLSSFVKWLYVREVKWPPAELDPVPLLEIMRIERHILSTAFVSDHGIPHIRRSSCLSMTSITQAIIRTTYYVPLI